jgi:metal-responsive CopG/Arc/MetJ family transcriptional regulator
MKPKDRPRKPATTIIAVRLTKNELTMLDRLAKIAGLTRSEMIRKWINLT